MAIKRQYLMMKLKNRLYFFIRPFIYINKIMTLKYKIVYLYSKIYLNPIKVVYMAHNIRETLVALRKDRRIKQSSVANHIGITRSSLSRYESGHTEMTFDKIELYASFLGFEIRLLLKG
jgi:predicted transcriptional regulator